MIREERELLAELARVNTDVPDFVLAFMGGGLSAEAERAFAYRLMDAAERILHHADAKEYLVIDGYAIGLPSQTGRPQLEPGERQ